VCIIKALVKYAKGAGNVRLMDMPKPVPGPEEVLVRVEACGICGTDIKIQDDHFIYDPPVIMGHEYSGSIAEVGERVSRFKPGDRVIGEQHVNACGKCSFCLSGRRHLCPSKRSPGYLSEGAFAHYIKVHESLLHIIPDEVSFDEAALVEPMGICAYAILERAKINPCETVVVLGCGPMSLISIQMILAAGASRVFVTGMDVDEKERAAMAIKFGAEKFINAGRTDAAKEILELTGGEGADVVVDLAGAPSAIVNGLDMLKKNGRLCAIGLPAGDVAVPWAKAVLKAVSFIYSFSSDNISWMRCLDMIKRGKVKLESFTSSVYPMTRWEDAFEEARSGRALKVIIHPWE
jgi:L-iditol 2-dehydrogenase